MISPHATSNIITTSKCQVQPWSWQWTSGTHGEFFKHKMCVIVCETGVINIYLEPKWPLFLKVNPPKQGLFQSKQGSFGFQVVITTESSTEGTKIMTPRGCEASLMSLNCEWHSCWTKPSKTQKNIEPQHVGFQVQNLLDTMVCFQYVHVVFKKTTWNTHLKKKNDLTR